CVSNKDALVDAPCRGLVATAKTVRPLPPAATPAAGAKPPHPSPSARQFRLLPNGLAAICAETDVLAADAAQGPMSGVPFDGARRGFVQVGGRVAQPCSVVRTRDRVAGAA